MDYSLFVFVWTLNFYWASQGNASAVFLSISSKNNSSPFSMTFFTNRVVRRELFSQSTTVVAQIGSFLLWLASLADLPVSSVISTHKLFPLKPKKYTLNAEFRKMYLKNNLNEKVFTVQPENIVLTERGGQTVKIIDFGTALQLRKGEKVLFAICECFSNFFFQRCRQWLAPLNLLLLRLVFKSDMHQSDW